MLVVATTSENVATYSTKKFYYRRRVWRARYQSFPSLVITIVCINIIKSKIIWYFLLLFLLILDWFNWNVLISFLNQASSSLAASSNRILENSKPNTVSVRHKVNFEDIQITYRDIEHALYSAIDIYNMTNGFGNFNEVINKKFGWTHSFLECINVTNNWWKFWFTILIKGVMQEQLEKVLFRASHTRIYRAKYILRIEVFNT